MSGAFTMRPGVMELSILRLIATGWRESMVFVACLCRNRFRPRSINVVIAIQRTTPSLDLSDGVLLLDDLARPRTQSLLDVLRPELPTQLQSFLSLRSRSYLQSPLAERCHPLPSRPLRGDSHRLHSGGLLFYRLILQANHSYWPLNTSEGT